MAGRSWGHDQTHHREHHADERNAPGDDNPMEDIASNTDLAAQSIVDDLARLNALRESVAGVEPLESIPMEPIPMEADEGE